MQHWIDCRQSAGILQKEKNAELAKEHLVLVLYAAPLPNPKKMAIFQSVIITS